MYDPRERAYRVTMACINQDSISIEERYCRGDLGLPKTSASAATIPVNKSVIERVQDHEMVQAVSSNRADQAFYVRILPGTSGRGEYFFNAQ
jgi:hypothetical protein